MFESDDEEFSSITPTEEVEVPVVLLSCAVLIVPPPTVPAPLDSEKADMALVASNVGLVTVAAKGRFKSSRPSGTGNLASSSRSCR